VRVLIVGEAAGSIPCLEAGPEPVLSRLYCAPGNAGIAALAECIDLSPVDIDGLCQFALKEKIDLTVVGPEAPLAAGLADRFRGAGLKVSGLAGPGRLESSKVWAKDRMRRWGIPTADLPSSVKRGGCAPPRATLC